MKRAAAVLALMMVVSGGIAADPVFIDQLMETPLDALQTHFADLKKDGCYRLADGRFVLINMDRKAGKPWRVALAVAEPCRRPDDVRTPMDLQHRKGIALGDGTAAVLEKIGRPDAMTEAEPKLRNLGDTEYFYICRVEQDCARHTSIFTRDGVVTGIAEWYSD